MYIYTQIFSYMYVCIYVYMYIYMHMHIHMYIYIYVCMHACMYVCMLARLEEGHHPALCLLRPHPLLEEVSEKQVLGTYCTRRSKE